MSKHVRNSTPGMPNRRGLFGVTLLATLALVVAACGGDTAETTTTGATQTTAADEETTTTVSPSGLVNDGVIRIGGGTTGGTAERAAGVIARAIEQDLEGYTGAVLPGSGRSNLVNISEGQAELGMGVPSGLESAYAGTGDFEGDARENVRYGGEMFSDLLAFTLVASVESGIETVADLEGKRLAPGEQASLSAQQFMPTVLEAAGLSYDAITEAGGEVVFTPFGDALQLLRDGQVDAVVHTVGHPNAELTTIDTTQGLQFVSLSDDEIEFASERLAGWAGTAISQDTYESLDSDWQTLSTSLVWGVRADVPDDVVYAITEAIYNNPDFWDEAGEGWSERVNVSEALTNIQAGGMAIPLHPGAEAYYSDAGVLSTED